MVISFQHGFYVTFIQYLFCTVGLAFPFLSQVTQATTMQCSIISLPKSDYSKKCFPTGNMVILFKYNFPRSISLNLQIFNKVSL